MKNKKQILELTATICILLLLILFAEIAAAGAKEGLSICIQVIIPSLFPFFFITSYLNSVLLCMNFPGIRPLCKHLRFPPGCEGLLLLGLIGGYPVGAQAVRDAWKAGKLHRQQAHILLGYCSNAGPAFIFGVAGSLFPSPIAPWMLWLIHILSALLTALLLPKGYAETNCVTEKPPITLLQAFQNSLRITASVCGWVIIFKVILSLFFSILPIFLAPLQIYLTGILELSGGCIALSNVASVSNRFIICSGFLAFGGICVLLQTASATADVGLGLYLPGKLIQTILSLLLSVFLLFLLHKNELPIHVILIGFPVSIVSICLLRRYCRKKLWKISNL